MDTTQPNTNSESEQSQLELEEEWAPSKLRRLGFGASVVGLVASVSAFLLIFFTSLDVTGPATPQAELPTARIEMLGAKLDVQEERLSQIAMSLRNLQDRPLGGADATVLATQIAALRAEFEGARERLESLEAAILEDPAQALSVPLLRRDLENLETSYRRDTESTAIAIDRVYDQNKWFIGTVAVGLVGLAISNFVQVRQKAPGV